ncbi:MAG: choice-of-anchor B family protein [Planctomycetes bacterium]|nr:choice-of-anchor B family protein [Planctomycetota bacterium]
MSLIALATAAVIAPIMMALAHEGDLKARDWEPPIFGPAWRLDDEPTKTTSAAMAFNANGIRLMSWFPCNTFDPSNTSGNDVWGYVSPSGREYALMGLSNGTGFVEVTNPGSASIVSFKTGPTSMWRNLKTYKTYAYAVSEGGGGIQVFDLSQIDNGIVTELPSVTTGGATATHTMIINTQTGYLYRMGGSTNGIRVYNLEPNPASPAYVSAWNPKYTHDGVVYHWTTGPYAGKEIFFACGGTNGGNTNTGLDILDITNKASITVIGRFTYSQAAFCHQVWLSEDRQYAYINDELDEDNFGVNSRGIIVNISNLAAPVSAGTYTTGVTSIDHNEYVKGNLLHCSNYTSGIRLFDISTPSTPVQVAWFDTYPNDDASPASTFNGLWSNYPYLPSGIILGSDIERGLFVWKIGQEPATVSYPEGQPAYFNPTGQRVAVQVATTAGYTVTPGGVVLTTTVGANSTATTMLPEGGGLYAVNSPPTPCGEPVSWSISVTTNDPVDLHDPLAGSYSATSALGTQVTVDQTFEANATGWVIGGTADGTVATSGIWVWADPVGTSAQPENDHTTSGVKCFVTGNATAGAGDGTNDIDGGQTTLTSPLLSVSGLTDPYVSYWRWYSNDKGAGPNEDNMPIYISGNNGANWVLLESVTENANDWVQKQFRVADFVTVTAAGIKLKFVARDIINGSLVEAAIDDVSVFALQCPELDPADLNGDGVVDGSDMGLLLLDFGPCPGCVSDLDGSGEVDGGDVGLMLLSYQ